MFLEENKTVIRKAIEALNKRDLASLDQFIAVDYVDRTNQIRSIGNLKQFYTRAFEDFPDFHRTIEDITAEGDKVWTHIKGSGTHKGEYHGLVPTGKKITWEANTILRIADGNIAEMWAFSDELNFCKQLGIIE